MSVDKTILAALRDSLAAHKARLRDARVRGDGVACGRAAKRLEQLRAAYASVTGRRMVVRSSEHRLREIVDEIDDAQRSRLISEAAEYLAAMDACAREVVQ